MPTRAGGGRRAGIRAAYLGAYIVLWLLADVASTQYAQGSGFSVWDVRAALDLLLFIGLGWAWWPLPVILAALRVALIPAGLHGSVLTNVLASIPYELTYAALAFARKPLRVRFPLRRLRDIGLFALLFCCAGPIVANGAALLVFRASGIAFDFLQQLLQGAVADATAICVFVPVATVLASWNRVAVRNEPESATSNWPVYITGSIAVILAVVLEYAVGTRSGLPLVEFSFLPLAWMSMATGVRGAVLAIMSCDITATLIHIGWHIPIDSQLEFQSFLIASALTALLLGVISTERSGLLEGLKRAAFYDEATGLPNRRWLSGMIDRNAGSPLSLIVVDLSDIRLLNEAIGRISGDAILAEFGRRLRREFDGGYEVARIRYDEFAVAYPEENNTADALTALRALTAKPFHVDDSTVYLDASIGALSIEANPGAYQAFRQVDIALRRARENPERVDLFRPSAGQAELPLPIAELHGAVDRGELTPFFQPIYRYDPAGNRWKLIGAECLLRWRHPRRGLLMPADFIGLLERSSLGARVGWEMMAQTMRIAKKWRADLPHFQMWLNVFARQILDPRSAHTLETVLRSSGAPPQSLVVEITENLVATHDERIADVARELRSAGVSIAIDDFGVGGSSLSRLRNIPVDLLKIDRSFVSRVDVDPKARAVVSAVIKLAAGLGVETLAEGIETVGQTQVLLEEGCFLAQGYVFAHPMPEDAFASEILRKPYLGHDGSRR